MAMFRKIDAITTGKVLSLVTQEREKALSKREWIHRLAGYGYAIRQTDNGDVVTTLPHGVEICTLPSALSA